MTCFLSENDDMLLLSKYKIDTYQEVSNKLRIFIVSEVAGINFPFPLSLSSPRALMAVISN